jgi:hypothetical protein
MMKNLLGGLFKTQENANLAYENLQISGFASEEISMFIHKPRKQTDRSTKINVQEIAKNAFLGGLILGTLGAIIGFLVGSGTVPLPGLEPGSITFTPRFLMACVVAGIIGGGLTGFILGAASRLLRSREKAEVTTQQIEKEGVLVTVNVANARHEAKARRIMEEYGAFEVGNPSEKWDLESWVSPNENNPSLANTR